VTVNALADAALVSVSNATGSEDSWIALSISAVSADVDGSETVTIDIRNVPIGSNFSAGTAISNTHWRMTSSQLAGLQFQAPRDAALPVNLNVTVTGTDGGSVAVQSLVLAVYVLPAPGSLTPVHSNGAARTRGSR
jgi:large repetitive protein